MNPPTQDMLDVIYQRLIKDGAQDDGPPVPWDYPARMFDMGTIRTLTGNPTWHWPRRRDLPKEEQKEFLSWLMVNQLPVPLLDMVMADDQDGYYPHDYMDWKDKREACHL